MSINRAYQKINVSVANGNIRDFRDQYIGLDHHKWTNKDTVVLVGKFEEYKDPTTQEASAVDLSGLLSLRLSADVELSASATNLFNIDTYNEGVLPEFEGRLNEGYVVHKITLNHAALDAHLGDNKSVTFVLQYSGQDSNGEAFSLPHEGMTITLSQGVDQDDAPNNPEPATTYLTTNETLSLLEGIDDLAALRALPQNSLRDKEQKFVASQSNWYWYDADAVSGDEAPDDQVGVTGFWKTVLQVAATQAEAENINTTDLIKRMPPQRVHQAIVQHINNLVNAAPGTLDTLEELAAALGDDENFAANTAASLAAALIRSNHTGSQPASSISDFDTEVGSNSTVQSAFSRANHTGSQPASSISDFDTEVGNNSTVQSAFSRANHTGSQLASTISNFDTEVANNSTVQSALSRANHTGSQPASSISDFDTAVANNSTVQSALSSTGVEASSYAINGYIELTDGLVLQWGRYLKNVSGTRTITFPVAFPNACLHANVSTYFTSEVGTAEAVVSYTTTSLNVTSQNAGASYYTLWFAIGY